MTTANPRQFDRNHFYTLLALGKQDLGWDDEFYYGIWLPMQGASKKNDKYSASTLSNTELFKAVEEMKRLGFKVKHKVNGNRAMADDPQSQKIRALWLELHAAGKVRDSSERALAHWVAGQVKSSHGIEALQWLNSRQASRLIEQLKRWLERPVKDASVVAEPVETVRGEPVEP